LAEGETVIDPERQDKYTLAEYDAKVTLRKASHEATIAFALAAIRSAFVMNGGAIVAILAFLGSRQNSDLHKAAIAVLQPASLFGYGIVLAAATAGGSYISQAAFSQVEKTKSALGIAGLIFQAVAIVAWAASLTLFLFGAHGMLLAFGGLK
jgi:hypothetical protein